MIKLAPRRLWDAWKAYAAHRGHAKRKAIAMNRRNVFSFCMNRWKECHNRRRLLVRVFASSERSWARRAKLDKYGYQFRFMKVIFAGWRRRATVQRNNAIAKWFRTRSRTQKAFLSWKQAFVIAQSRRILQLDAQRIVFEAWRETSLETKRTISSFRAFWGHVMPIVRVFKTWKKGVEAMKEERSNDKMRAVLSSWRRRTRYKKIKEAYSSQPLLRRFFNSWEHHSRSASLCLHRQIKDGILSSSSGDGTRPRVKLTAVKKDREKENAAPVVAESSKHPPRGGRNINVEAARKTMKCEGSKSFLKVITRQERTYERSAMNAWQQWWTVTSFRACGNKNVPH